MKTRIIGIFVVAIFLGLFATDTTRAAPPPQDGTSTPFQRAFQEAIKDRKFKGLAVPSVTYDYQVTGQAANTSTASSTAPIKITGKTIIHFDNPEQAGYNKWPALAVKNNLPPEVKGSVREGDYTEDYRQLMEQKFPGIWGMYQFGYEPRDRIVEETYEITPTQNDLAPASQLSMSNNASLEQILMGFTYTGPHINYTINDRKQVCVPFFGCATIYEFKAGFELDWALGLRLPGEASLTGPSQLVQGSSYSLSSAFTPLDWSATSYSGVGVAPEQGNEFVLRMSFFVGVQGKVLGVDLCSSCYVSVDINKSASFPTPFGSGAYFPISAIDIPIYTFDLSLFSFSVGLGIQPKLGSDRITADWQAVPGTDCSGSGQITYSQPGVPVSVGPVKACNLGPTNRATIRLAEFRYWFNQFLVELSARLRFSLFHYGVWSRTVPIAQFNLSPITSGLWLGKHRQCTWDFKCSNVGPSNTVDLSILTVDQNPPTTSITLSGTAGNNGWYRSNVQVNLNATDNPPGCGVGVNKTEYSFNGTTWNAYGSPFTIGNEGTTTVYYRSTDNAGNVESTKTQIIKVDKTPPVITGAPTTQPNSYGWYNTNVVVHFTASDALAGLDTLTPDQTLSNEGANQSVTGTATDKAGNSVSFTVTGINIDKTNPTISISSPQATTYANTANFNVQWLVVDSLSGIATQKGSLDGSVVTNGQFVDLLPLGAGQHTVMVEATDKAGNANSASVQFVVTTTVTDINGLIAETKRMCELGWINKPGICNSLNSKLKAAQAAIERGQLNAAKNQLEAFINELESQNGKAIGQQAFDVLKADALYVIQHLK